MGIREEIMQALGIGQADAMGPNEQVAYKAATGEPINGPASAPAPVTPFGGDQAPLDPNKTRVLPDGRRLTEQEYTAMLRAAAALRAKVPQAAQP